MTSNSKKWHKIKTRKFIEEFNTECSLDINNGQYPDWVIKSHVEQLNYLSAPLMKLCTILQMAGVEFRVKYPIELEGGRWRFADIYLPQSDTAIMVQSRGQMQQPTLFADERTELIAGSCNVRTVGYDFKDDTVMELLESVSMN